MGGKTDEIGLGSVQVAHYIARELSDDHKFVFPNGPGPHDGGSVQSGRLGRDFIEACPLARVPERVGPELAASGGGNAVPSLCSRLQASETAAWCKALGALSRIGNRKLAKVPVFRL